MITAFPLIAVCLLGLWVFFFIFDRELRQEMLLVSLAAFFLAPLMLVIQGGDMTQIALRFAGVRFMDLVFLFAVAGLAASIYHALFGKHYHRLPKIKRKVGDERIVTEIWLLRIFVAALAFFWSIILLRFALQLSPAAAAGAAAVLVALYIVTHRHDLVLDALVSALLMSAIVFMASGIALFAAPEALQTPLIQNAARLATVPRDLVLLSAAFGLALGPLYEYTRRFTLR